MLVDGFPSQSDGFDSRSPLHSPNAIFKAEFGGIGDLSPNLSTQHSKLHHAKSRKILRVRAQGRPIWLAHRVASRPLMAGPTAARLARLDQSATLPASHAPGARPCWSLGHIIVWCRSVRMCSPFACFAVSSLLLILATSASAQPNTRPECANFNPYTQTREQIEACVGPGHWNDSGFSPYNPSGQPLFEPIKVQAWANVLIGIPGVDNDYGAYLTLENDTEANTAQVIVRGASGVIQRFFFLSPDQRIAERLNDWPELHGQLPIGVSVRVRWMKEGNAGVSMHRARDFGSMVQAVEGSGTK